MSPNAEFFDPVTSSKATFEFTVDDIVFADDHMMVSFFGIKNDYLHRGNQVPVHRSSDPLVCPVRALHTYIDRTKQWCSDTRKHVFLQLSGSHDGLSVSSIARVLSGAIKDAGLIGYSAKDFRPTGATAAVKAGVHDAAVMRVGRWRSVAVFREHYVHYQTPADFTDMVLGTT